MESIHLPSVITKSIDAPSEQYIVCHNDPFNPGDTTIVLVPAGVSCYEALKDFSYDIEYYDLVVSKNQEILDADFIIEEHDIVSFSLIPKGGGGGKQIFQVIAMIAIIAVAPMLGAALGGLMAGGFAGFVGGYAVLGTALVTVAGSMLVSALFKPAVPSSPSLESFEQSTTYGWNTSGNAIAQGSVIPVLYGTTRVTPQYIGKYLVTASNKQYLKALLAVGEGPLDYISGIEINDSDISAFTDTSYSSRLGTNTQSIIADFNDTWVDQSVNKALTDNTTWVTAQTSGDSVNSLTVGVLCPRGIYYANDSGGLDSYSVTLDIEYRKVGSTTWLNMPTTATNTTLYYVDQNPTVTVTYTYWGWPTFTRTADLTGPYDVYQKANPVNWWTSNSFEYVETVSSLPEGVTTKAVYTPTGQIAWTANSTLVGPTYYKITDKITSAVRTSYQLTGLEPAAYEVRMRFYNNPNTTSRYGSSTYFEFLQEAISDDFTYPNTALLALNVMATDQLSGSLPKITCIASRTTGTYGRLDNPAWACLDLLMNSRYGAGIPLTRIDFQSFQDWADYCTAEGFTINLLLDQGLNLIQCIQMIGQLGRGTVMQYGSSFVALVDKADLLPTQGFLFSMGNIIQDSFSETFLPLKERANIIEITYYDLENNYDRTAIEVSQGNYDLTHQVNKTSINLLGCVTKEQALRQAKFHLNQNRYITITASWEASIDAIACKVGDIVNVAHDVPQWGFSGRIISSTTDTITVDRSDLVLEPGKTFTIQVSDSNTDEQLYYTILSIAGNILTVDATLGTIGDYSVYAFGEINRHAKKMRILSISTAGDLKRKITAIEYNSNVYNDAVTVPTPLLTSSLGTNNVVISEYLTTKLDGTIEPIVQLSWKGAKLSYNIFYKRTTDSTYVQAGVARGTTFEIPGLKELIEYDFLIDEVKSSYTVLGKTIPPEPVSNVVGSESGNVFNITWDYPFVPLDFKEFLIYDDTTQIGSTTSTKFITERLFGSISKTFTVKAIDTTGNLSTGVDVEIPISPIAQVVALTGSIAEDKLTLSWEDPNRPDDFAHYRITNSDGYVGISTSETYTSIAPKHTVGSHTYSVAVIDLSGNSSPLTDVSIVIVPAVISNITYTFVNNDVTVTWETVSPNYSVNSYNTTIGLNSYSSSSPTVGFNCVWLGTRTATIIATDYAGNTSSENIGIEIIAPEAPVINVTTSGSSGVSFSWTTQENSCGIKEYLILYRGNYSTTATAAYFAPITSQDSYTLEVVAIDYAGNPSISTVKTVAVVAPSISLINSSTTNTTIELEWLPVLGTFDIKEYEVSYLDGTTTVVRLSATPSISINTNWIGNKTFSISPIDIAGNTGSVLRHVSYTTPPLVPLVTSEVVGEDIVLSIVERKGSFALANVEISYDSTVLTVAAGTPTWSIPIFWDLDKEFTVTSIDSLGNRSGSAVSTVSISEGSISTIYTSVVDNNVMIYWSGVAGTLPIEHFRILKGATYSTAVEIGISKSTFIAIFENSAGVYTYWVEPIDTAGNAGVVSSTATSVSQPPDFILNVEWVSDWSGTKTNMKQRADGKYVVAINTTETFSEHFVDNTWGSAQDQITAGYPLWLTPGASIATYSQTFDYGTLLGSTSITLSDPVITINGTGTYVMNRTISVSEDGITWVEQPLNSLQVFVVNIRYVKVDYSWEPQDDILLIVDVFTLRLDAKIKSDNGTVNCLNTDVGGTIVNFNIPFVDITAIGLTPQGSTPLIAVYDFVDIPNPTEFKILLYTLAGVRASGIVSWTSSGY